MPPYVRKRRKVYSHQNALKRILERAIYAIVALSLAHATPLIHVDDAALLAGHGSRLHGVGDNADRVGGRRFLGRRQRSWLIVVVRDWGERVDAFLGDILGRSLRCRGMAVRV